MSELSYMCFEIKLFLLIQWGQDNMTVKSMLTPGSYKAHNGVPNLLQFSAQFGNDEIVKHLIELGADVNNSTEHGTPLMQAVLNKHLKVVDVLLGANADIRSIDAKGDSALQVVLQPNYNDDKIALRFLLKLCHESRTIDELVDQLNAVGCTFYTASLLENVEVLGSMLRRACDINVKGTKGRTALHVAAKKNNLQLANWLINSGANVNALNDRGMSPLFYAAKRKNKDMLKLFLDFGANPNVEDELGSTPLMEVLRSWRETDCETEECAELLLKRGAIPKNESDPGDFTIFDWALISESTKTAKLLAAHLAFLDKHCESIAESVMYCNNDELSPTLFIEVEDYYEQCQRILEVIVFGPLTLFDLLKMSEHKIRACVRNKTFVPMVEEMCFQHDLNKEFPYFFDTLVANLSVGVDIVKLEDVVISTICDIFDANYNECYLAARKIAGYLNANDLEQLSRV